MPVAIAPAPTAFRLVAPPDPGDQAPDVATASAWTRDQHHLAARLSSPTESAFLPGRGRVDRLSVECPGGCGRHVHLFVTGDDPFRFGTWDQPIQPTPCPSCQFNAVLASVAGLEGSLTHQPDDGAAAKAERESFAATYPTIFAALDSAGVLPAAQPPEQVGPLVWIEVLVARSSVDLFRPIRDGRFSAGDFGAVGKLADAVVSDQGRWWPDLLDDLGRNALAVERGYGLIVARYSPTTAESYGSPRASIVVTGLLSGGSVRCAVRQPG